MKELILIAMMGVLLSAVLFLFMSGHYEWKHWSHWTPPEVTIVKGKNFTRVDVSTDSMTDSSMIHSWLYLPQPESPKPTYPTIIMSPGLGEQKDMGIDKYAVKLVKQGYAVLSIDYRSFGGSQGIAGTIEHRNDINPWFHIADIKTILRKIQLDRFDRRIDKNNIILYGVGFSGGHVIQATYDLQIMNRIQGIKGIILQNPWLNGHHISSQLVFNRGYLSVIRLFILCYLDTFLSYMLDYSPFYIKMFGYKNETAYIQLSPDDYQKFYTRHPKKYLGHWENMSPARSLKYFYFYNPIYIISQVKVPMFLLGSNNDSMSPVSVLETVTNTTTYAELEINDIASMDIYNITSVNTLSPLMLEFIRKVTSTTCDNNNDMSCSN